MIWLLLLIPFAYGDQIPDYDDPYSPIFTDKEIYTWTDKVKITILAPSWNTDRHLIDDIGIDEGNFIKISTRDYSLEPYRLTETQANNGVFTGEVILTGFSHDVNGDNVSDIMPRTSGSGPTNGFIQTERDSAITISFEFADGVVVTESIPISWNIGTIQFFEKEYNVGQNIEIQVFDPDMNLNPEGIDQVNIDVYSDSDLAGIDVEAIETREDSGMFHANILISQTNESSGNQLFSKPGDVISAKYEDRTLPSPYNISDELSIMDHTSLISNVLPTFKSKIQSVKLSDSFGNNLSNIYSNQQVQIVGQVVNNQEYEQFFTYLLQIKDSNKSMIKLSWVSGILKPSETLEVSQSWTPNVSGNYTIESFMWESINSMKPISNPSINEVIVK